MAEPSKILTVSYGTFSCTLEGFDDAFDTMKAIAEYFRDLAADDRYFGAEPPTPDPEMLARIAEREVERRVEARLERGAYVLRPAALTTAAGLAAAGTSAHEPPPAAEAPTTRHVAPETAPNAAAAEAAVAEDTLDEEMTPPEAEAQVEDTPEAQAEAEDTPEVEAQAEDISEAEGQAEDAPEVEVEAEDAPEAEVEAEDTSEAEVEVDDTSEAEAEAEDTSEAEAEAEDTSEAEAQAEDTPEAEAQAEDTSEAEVEAEDTPEAEAQAEDTSEAEAQAEDTPEAEAQAEDTSEAEAEEALAEEVGTPDTAAGPEAESTEPETATASEETADPIETKPWEQLTAEERSEFRRRRKAERDAAIAQSGENAGHAFEPENAEAPNDDAETLGAAPESDWHGEAGDLSPEGDTAAAETRSEETPETPAEEAETDSVAAKLARIRAVVGTGAAGALGAAAIATGEEDEPVIATGSASDPDLDALRSLISQNDGLADGAADTEAMQSEADADVRHAEAAPEPPEEAVSAPIRARVVKMRRSDFEARYGDMNRDAGDSGSTSETDADLPDVAEQADAASPDEADLSDLARLDGQQDPEIDTTALETGTETETEQDLADLGRLDGLEEYEADIAGLAGPASSLSPDAEAELMEELAEVERMGFEDDDEGDLTDEALAQEVPDSVEPEADPVAEAADSDDPEALPRENRSSLLATSPEADEADMSRILSETDARFNEPEASRRRDAIAHLKAAVAATEAARQLGDDGGERDEGENMFRDDLEQVVRPRRTARPLTRSERPRPAPLKLVASQRVDAPQAAASQEGRQVLPRRVEAGASVPDAAEAAAQERFARFASDMGTGGLTDMIEAAAAHAIFNEGEEDISRPQLMRMVQAVVPGEFSREDGLRAFGTLLRQGRLEKVSSGRFRVSPQTRFNPRRAASGS